MNTDVGYKEISDCTNKVGYVTLRYATAQMVDEPRYKPEGSGFDSRRCLRFFINLIPPAALWPWISFTFRQIHSQVTAPVPIK